VALLETSAVYVLPRISVDGAERYLTTEHSLRSSPLDAAAAPGGPSLVPRDVDGAHGAAATRVHGARSATQPCDTW
jgi:hypothetical protein